MYAVSCNGAYDAMEAAYPILMCLTQPVCAIILQIESKIASQEMDLLSCFVG